MFDYLASKPSRTEKPAWLGVLGSACSIFCGAVAVGRQRVLGWPIVILGTVALLMSIRRFLAPRRDEANAMTENFNG
jgi:hypothetical protein